MSSILRQSGSALAKISRSSLQASSRRVASPYVLRLQRQQLRGFATPPPPRPSSSNDSKDQKDGADLNKESDASGAAQKGEGVEKTKDTLRDGYVRLDAEETEALWNTLETMKKALPQSQIKAFEKAVADVEKNGVPKGLKEILEETRGKPMGLATAARLTRLLMNEIVRDVKNERTTAKSKFDSPKFPSFTSQSSKRPGEESKSDSKNESSQGSKKKADGKFDGPIGSTTPSMDLFLIAGSLLTTYLLFGSILPGGESSKDISYQEFRSMFLDKGLVEKLTVKSDRGGVKVRVDLNTQATQAMYPDSPAANPNFHYNFSIGSVEVFERRMDDAQEELGIPLEERIPISYASTSSMWDLALSFGPTILLVGLLVFASRRAGGATGGSNSVFGMGKSRAKKFNHETDIKVKFADVAGMDEAKLEIMEFVSFLKTPEQFERLGAKIPRGAILSGPPGTGKTLLAKATAGESQVPFFSVSGSEFVEMFVGVGASRVRDLFTMARKNTPCIIFIDEIDAIGKARGKSGSFNGGNDEREATLNQILTEMDGFNTSEQVVVLAGTNRPDVLDKALMRPGRFDRHISIDKPTMDGRKQIFLVHLKKIVTNEDLEYLTGRLSALTPGFSGADIANCVNEAALIAARTSASSVAMLHFEQAIERVIGGLEKKSLVLSPEEKRVVAYHEAGHAICGWYFKYADPLLKVSIIPRGQGALGYAQYLPAGDTYLMNVNQLMDRMAMTLGGRISEELHFDTVTSGASDDFNKVTRMATAMVTKWGMSKKLGPLHFEDDENRFNKPFAESTAQTIDAEVRRIVDEAYKQCMDLLTAKKKEVGLVAEELLSKEVLGRADMVRLLGKREWDDNKEFSKYFDATGKPVAPLPLPEDTSEPPKPAQI